MYDYPPPAYDPSEPLKPLEPRQKRFCDEYLKDLNATAAAKRAGYKPKNADNTGSKILALPQAKAYIEEKLKEIAEQTTRRNLVMNRELMDIVFTGIGDVFDDQGDIKNLSDIPEEFRRAIDVKTQRIKMKNGTYSTATTYTLLNRVKLLEKFSELFLEPTPKRRNRWR